MKGRGAVWTLLLCYKQHISAVERYVVKLPKRNSLPFLCEQIFRCDDPSVIMLSVFKATNASTCSMAGFRKSGTVWMVEG